MGEWDATNCNSVARCAGGGVGVSFHTFHDSTSTVFVCVRGVAWGDDTESGRTPRERPLTRPQNPLPPNGQGEGEDAAIAKRHSSAGFGMSREDWWWIWCVVVTGEGTHGSRDCASPRLG